MSGTAQILVSGQGIALSQYFDHWPPCLCGYADGLIADTPDKRRISPPALSPKGKAKAYRRTPVTRRPKGYRPSQIGECVGLDAIERRRQVAGGYLLTSIDEASGYALVLAVPKRNSRAARDFSEKALSLTPFPIQQVITDSGVTFKGAFDQRLNDSQILHLYTYPKTPKMNAVAGELVEPSVSVLIAPWLVSLSNPIQYNKKGNRGWTYTDYTPTDFDLYYCRGISPFVN